MAQPRDGRKLPYFAPFNGVSEEVAMTTTSSAAAKFITGEAGYGECLRMVGTDAFHIEMGTGDVGAATVDSFYVPANHEQYIVPGSYTHFRVLSAGADKKLYIGWAF